MEKTTSLADFNRKMKADKRYEYLLVHAWADSVWSSTGKMITEETLRKSKTWLDEWIKNEIHIRINCNDMIHYLNRYIRCIEDKYPNIVPPDTQLQLF